MEGEWTLRPSDTCPETRLESWEEPGAQTAVDGVEKAESRRVALSRGSSGISAVSHLQPTIQSFLPRKQPFQVGVWGVGTGKLQFQACDGPSLGALEDSLPTCLGPQSVPECFLPHSKRLSA